VVADSTGNIRDQQSVARKDRVSCEVNSIGATGAKPPLLGRTSICVGTRTGQSGKIRIINASDYAGLPSSLLCPYQMLTKVDGKSKRGRWENFRRQAWLGSREEIFPESQALPRGIPSPPLAGRSRI